MKKILFLLSIICAFEVNAQNYYISFTGSGNSTTVGSVKVENLAEGTSLTVNPGYRLSLTFPTGISSLDDKQSTELSIYPNPTTGSSFFRIFPPESGEAAISVFDINGRSIYQVQSNLERALQEFRISGLNSGFYLVSVKGNRYQYSGKLVSNAEASGKISIEKISNSIPVNEKSSKTGSKGSLNTNASQPTVDMIYTDGDRLKFTGISGIYSTVITDIPASDKTINFNFIDCTDGDNNNYPVVQIGTQVWMAGNLKTAKYRNGESIETTIPEDLNIIGESTPKYQWVYDEVGVNVEVYGRLYTWYAVTDSRNVCPAGWHVPTETEFTTLSDYLIASGYNYDGTTTGNKIAKALASTDLWVTDSGTGTIGNTDYPSKRNSTGFSALPGGERTPGGGFNVLGNIGYLWTATEHEATGAEEVFFSWCSSDLGIFSYTDKKWGHSVRCLKD